MRALDDWEKFVHDPKPQLPLLVRAALLHYQFETIHPFLDGNGRLGRLLLVIYLVQQRRLAAPLLYLSAYFERHRNAYYDHLQGVRERGAIDAWLQFFLTAVRDQATDAVQRAEALVDLRERYRERLRGRRSRAGEVIDVLFEYPIVTADVVRRRLGVTPQGALLLLRQVTATGTLREVSRGRGIPGRWYADELLEVLSGG